jgi:uncharacterized protein YxjI
MNAAAPIATIDRKYVAKKAMFSFLGATFRLYDTAGQLRFYIKQKAFKLKEEITVFADEGKTEPRMTIKARSISDFSGGYDIADAVTGASIGGAQRNGLKSMFKDEWNILDADGEVCGQVKELGGAFAVLRRLIKLFQWIPQKYEITYLGDVVGHVKQQFNPFQLAYDVEFTETSDFDPRLGVGMVVLLLAIEGRG